MRHLTSKVWWILMPRGILGLILGAASLWLLGSSERAGDGSGLSLLVRPVELTMVLILLLGFYAFLDGLFSVLLGIQDFGQGRRWWALVGEGMMMIGLGLLAWMRPGSSILILLYWVAAWAILSGLMEISQGLRGTEYRDRRPTFFYAGLLSLGFGVAMLWQGSEIERLVWTIALYALVSAVPPLILGYHLRRFRQGALKKRGRVVILLKG